MAGDNSGRCSCSAEQIQRYHSRISGPLLDRIDIQIEVFIEFYSAANSCGFTVALTVVRRRVIEARQLQLQRAGKANALLGGSELARFCHIDGRRLQLLETAAEQLFLLPRACHRILKVARTIADMDGAETIKVNHIAEAIAFRCLRTG